MVDFLRFSMLSCHLYINILLFRLILFFLIVLTGTSSTMLNRGGDSGHASLVPSLRGKYSFALDSDIDCSSVDIHCSFKIISLL